MYCLKDFLILDLGRNFSLIYMKDGRPMVENNTWTKSYYIHRGRLIPCLTLDPPVKMISPPYRSVVMPLNLN